MRPRRTGGLWGPGARWGWREAAPSSSLPGEGRPLPAPAALLDDFWAWECGKGGVGGVLGFGDRKGTLRGNTGLQVLQGSVCSWGPAPVCPILHQHRSRSPQTALSKGERGSRQQDRPVPPAWPPNIIFTQSTKQLLTWPLEPPLRREGTEEAGPGPGVSPQPHTPTTPPGGPDVATRTRLSVLARDPGHRTQDPGRRGTGRNQGCQGLRWGRFSAETLSHG